MLPPRVNNNVGIVPIRGNTINPTIITQLRRAALDEQELQIIPVTITVNATAPAWSLQQGVILYNGHYYIPATSPLLQELPESVGTPTPQFLAVSFNTAASKPATQAFPSSVLLIEDWPQLPSRLRHRRAHLRHPGDHIPASKMATALYRHIMGQVDAGQVYNFPQLPQIMQVLHLRGSYQAPP
jgi:hypothetical protein